MWITLFWVAMIVIAWLSYAIWNLTRKLEAYEDATDDTRVFFEQLQTQLVSVLQQIRNVDLRGAFETDDEVGIVFKGMKAMIETLNVFLLKEQDAKKEENR